MSGGWYKRMRNIPERPWFKDTQVTVLFDYLEATAYVVDGRYEGVLIRRGSCPTTRSEMMEATGLSYKQVNRCLKVLSSYGEIIVKGNSRFSVITICSYDGFNGSLPLFGTAEDIAEGTTEGTAEGTTEGTTHLSTIEERYKETLITPCSPYKKEREKGDEALEIKRRYNKTFDGMLPACSRLSTAAALMVKECLRRFGYQSVDMVFEQIKNEPFSLGQNNTGFIANFSFIFTPKNYQQYLERAQLRKKKESTQKPQPAVGVIEVEMQPQRQSSSEYETNMRKYAAEHPDSRAAQIVSEWDKNKQTTV